MLGHAPLRQVLATIKAMRGKGIASTAITQEDVRQFVKDGCGTCESAKMRRRAFTIKTVADKTPAPIGKKWVMDELKLRVPTAEYGYTLVAFFVCATSGRHILVGMLDETGPSVAAAQGKLKARVRPLHGNVLILKMDSLPAHRSLHVDDVLASQQTDKQLSPPYVHELVGAAERAIGVSVPRANCLLMGSSDLDESHMYSARCSLSSKASMTPSRRALIRPRRIACAT